MKSVLLIGVGNFGSQLAKQLNDRGHQVMAVDKNETRVNDILPFVTEALIGDSTNREFLRTLGVGNYDVCIVTISSDFQSSLETASLLKELGATLVVSRADREVQEKFLLRNGADEVINPEKQIARWAAIRYTANNIADYIRLDDEHAIFEVRVPAPWLGRTVGAIDIRKKYGINILAVREDGKMDLSVTPETVLTANMTLLILGEQRSIEKCFRI
ncbi:MAG: TrkA family potassium uptake protein [Clostridia bacterium]|nr:TrkA family potassium uptake protein [Clostridia bacterium]